LLASVGAVTSLADERVSGSLDVLLTTPLPTWRIVWGKWRGAYRLVPWLAVLPAVNVLAVARHGSGWLAVPLMILLVLAYGAGVTSIGLACATWVRRFGRAVAAGLTVYALVTVGWLAAVMALGGGPDREWLASGSPFFGPGMLTAVVGFGPSSGDSFGWIIMWTSLYGAGAGLLYLAVLGTFNRCLGRMPERADARLAPLASRRNWSLALPMPRPPEDIAAPLVVEAPGQDE
jgi:ABC-type transport system involved in multi-copper enzyme maturation permease subunit